MGKKGKVGKQRKDKFYKLAKETGFRSRASFKLIQLNRKFEFLQKSNILVDLCAAPGGWLQVAQQSMPVSGLIIGVDLVSIKPIPNVISLQEDITTDKCRQALKRQLKTWKADTVLHDGAPNVGKSWLHDAFAQAQLTLSALKLATELLKPGGWFVSKVFRSKDYNSLLWVFGKLFKKVHVTKPQASRNESAEIFVVCQGYTAPARIDPRFLDPAYLFKEVEDKNDIRNVFLNATKRKVKAEGYEDGDKSVFSQLKASEFIFGDNHLELFAKNSEIIFDDEDIRDHRTTTDDVKEYCKDLKVLNKGEIRALLTWRKKLRESIKKEGRKENIFNSGDDQKQSVEELEMEDAVNEAKKIELSKFQELKRKKKKILKEKRKQHERINLKMIIKDDEPIIQEDAELFSISVVKNKKDLTKLEDEENLEFGEDQEQEKSDNEDSFKPYRSTYVSYDRRKDYNAWEDEENIESHASSEEDDDDDEAELEFATVKNNESDSDAEDNSVAENSKCDEDSENPLLVDLVSKDEKLADVVSKWFDKEEFDSIDEDGGLDFELLAENSKSKDSLPAKKVVGAHELPKTESKQVKRTCDEQNAGEGKKKKKKLKLDPEGLALGTLIIRSKKTKRDIMDEAYNRYASNEEGLPDWFVKDEDKHNRKQLPVSAEMVAEYKAQLREINARPIKKVIEAKARKKQKALRRMEKARKRAEAVTENLDMSEKEKMEQLKSIYKKAQTKKDTNVTYVVAKKGVGKRVRRPAGVKGRFKVVDKRMKKDDRKKKLDMKSQKLHKPKKNNKQKRKKK